MRSSRVFDASFVEEDLLLPGGGTAGSDLDSGSSTFELVALFSLKALRAHEYLTPL